jgi:hypothetical protein
MRIPPQVTERVKEAPAQALRAVFSGIGQVLLVADRIKSRATEPDRPRPASADPPAPSRPDAAPDVRDETRWRSLDETGNVRLLSEEEAPPAEPAAETAGTAGTTPAAEPAAEPATAKVTSAPEPAIAETPSAEPAAAAAEPAAAATKPAGQAEPAGQTTGEPPVPAEASLPVPNYDSLTIASLRARLRNLDQSQVQVLFDYEKANAGRADVLTMFERRIAKLESDKA